MKNQRNSDNRPLEQHNKIICFNVLKWMYTVFQKKTSTHIIGYKLINSRLILIIFDTKILHIIGHRKTA